MLIKDIQGLLNATVMCGEDLLDNNVEKACGSDLMSDVLAFGGGHGALVTGLVNPQVIRTAEMMDICCVVFARGKSPDEVMIKMACERDIVLMTSNMGMLSACGELYKAGLRDDRG